MSDQLEEEMSRREALILGVLTFIGIALLVGILGQNKPDQDPPPTAFSAVLDCATCLSIEVFSSTRGDTLVANLAHGQRVVVIDSQDMGGWTAYKIQAGDIVGWVDDMKIRWADD